MQWKAAIGASLLMLGILILARGAFLPADTNQGKLIVFIGGLLVIASYALMWAHFHGKVEKLEEEAEAKKHRGDQVEDAEHKVD